MAEENKRKFKYGDNEYDTEQIAKYLHENASGYAQSQGWNQDDVNGFMSSVNDLIGRVQSGDVDSLNYQGLVHTNSGGFLNMPEERKKILGIGIGKKSKDYNGRAVYYLDLAMQYMSKNKPTETSTKEKYSNEGLSKAWKNKYFGGNDPDSSGLESIWLNLDLVGEDGKRARTSRLNSYAQLLNDYANSEDLDKYDYIGSAHKNAEDYRNKLRAAATAALSGDYDAFIRAYGAAGGNLDEANTMFTEGTVKPVEKSEFDTAWEEQLKNIPPGTSPELIALMKLQFLQLWNQLKFGDFYDWDYRNQYNNWANQHYTSSGSDLLASLGTTAWNDDDRLFWLGSGLDTDEGQKRYGYFNDKNHKAYALKLFDDLISGKSINLEATAPSSGKKNKDILRAFMYQGKQGSNNDITEIDKDSYFINSTFDINTGTGIKYNSKKRTFERVHVDQTKTPKLAKALKEKWLKTNPYKGAGNLLTWAKKGAKLRALKFGDNIQQTSKDRVDKLYEDAILKEMKETGKTRRLVELGHGHGLFGSNQREGIDEIKMTTSDWMRLGSALNDIASIGVSYTGAGMPIAAAMLLGGLGVDTAADIIDPSKSWGEVGTNLLTNIGLGAATAIGGGALAKAGKIGKTLKTLLPIAMTTMGASLLMQDPNFKKTVDKITSGNWKSFTSNDMKNINMLTKLVAGGHQATKSAAGAIGTQHGNLNSITGRIARGAGKWGNNAWNSKRFSSLRANYNLMKAFNLQGGMKQSVIATTSDGMVEIGGLKVKPETAKLMLEAGNKARRSGKNATDILNEMLNAFRNSAEGKTKIIPEQTIPEVKANLLNVAEGSNVAANRAAVENAIGLQAEGTGFKLNGNFMEGDGRFNLNGKTNVASGDVPSELMAIYDQAIANGKSHTEAQGLINNVLGTLFNKPASTTPESGMPGFNFDNIVGDKGWWNPSRYFGNVTKITDNNPGWFARHNTKYSSPLDANTPEGRANLAIFKNNPLNRGNWNSDVAFNLGLGFKNTGINSGLQSMLEYGLQLRQQRTNIAPELSGNINNAKNMITSYKSKLGFTGSDKDALIQAKQEALATGRSLKNILRNPNPNTDGTVATKVATIKAIKNSNRHPLSHDAQVMLQAEGVNLLDKRANLIHSYNQGYLRNLLGLNGNQEIHAVYKGTSGLYYWWKQGGKLKALKELRFTQEETTSLKNGGIIKMNQGGVSEYSKPTEPYADLNGTSNNLVNGVSSDLSNKNPLLSLKNPLQDINYWSLLRFFDADRTNRKMKDMFLKNYQWSTQEYTPKHLNVYGDLGSLLQGTLSANAIRSTAGLISNNMSNGRDAITARLAGEQSAQLAEMQGRLAYNKGIEETKKAATVQEFDNIDKELAIANENSDRRASAFNVKLNNLLEYVNQLHANRNAWMSEQDLLSQQKKDDQKLFNQQILNYQYKQKMRDPLLEALYRKVSATGATQADINAYNDKKREVEDTANLWMYGEMAKLHGFSNPLTLLKYDKTPYLFKLKSGGKVSEDGPRKTRSKDLERHRKSHKDHMDNNNKKLDRLGRMTYLYAKRAQGK